VGTRKNFLISLTDVYDHPTGLVGSKARNLSLCLKEGFRVPKGFSISAEAYSYFISYNKLESILEFELYRKPLDGMRWEEIWDVAFRIRSAFLKAPIPGDLMDNIAAASAKWPPETLFAVRSSSSSEDSASASFAGIHESYLNVKASELPEKLKLVWASLWSDRALLYRREKQLDLRNSVMPVVAQVMEPPTVAGIAFTADPLTGQDNVMIIEMISGSLDLLVDNVKEPVRYRLDKKGSIKMNDNSHDPNTSLSLDDLKQLRSKLLQLEELFGFPIDSEWTGLGDNFTVLQVRPITTTDVSKNNDDRSWYLSLTPGRKALYALAERVEHQLIPALEVEIDVFYGQDPASLSIEQLSEGLKKRGESYRHWTKVYREYFIPFAHGIRSFGDYYNELVKPEDPYEFIEMLKGEKLLAQDRNRQLDKLSGLLTEDRQLLNAARFCLTSKESDDWEKCFSDAAGGAVAAKEFVAALLALLSGQVDLYYDHRSLADDPKMILQTILTMAENGPKRFYKEKKPGELVKLEKAYLAKAGPARHDEAENILRIGRLSWRLRDDDNILLGKLENQLLQFIREGLARLSENGLPLTIPEKIILEDWEAVLEALHTNTMPLLTVVEVKAENARREDLKPRQLVGQPSSPGTATGKARVIKGIEDFKDIKQGEILIFDAVQPQMTFLVSLAGAIVERRGGMLVHSSIIAREMNIPAVNGVSRATELIETGELVTVNGDLGLVVIGEPEFELERVTMP
jgi:phosphohistidine swiveling domain-containing protein